MRAGRITRRDDNVSAGGDGLVELARSITVRPQSLGLLECTETSAVVHRNVCS
jgi:hypothetical protein